MIDDYFYQTDSIPPIDVEQMKDLLENPPMLCGEEGSVHKNLSDTNFVLQKKSKIKSKTGTITNNAIEDAKIDLEKVISRGTRIEVFLGADDKIIDSKEAYEFFKEYATVYFIKNKGHIL